MISRRNVLFGLVTTPFVIREASVLMPVKAVRTPLALVSGRYLDGTHFTKQVYDEISVAGVFDLDWFDNVGSVSEFKYLNGAGASVSEDPSFHKRIDPQFGQPLKPIAERVGYSSFKDDFDYDAWEIKTFYSIDQLKKNQTAHTLTDNGVKVEKLMGVWDPGPSWTS
jgi:hypothetical protein